MMHHDALGIAGRARGVVQADGVPFVLGHSRRMVGVALRQPGFVLDLADQLAGPLENRIVDIDHEGQGLAGRLQQRQGLPDHRRKIRDR